MQVNGLSGAGSKTAGIKMAQKMDSFSINIKNEIARKQKEQQLSGCWNFRSVCLKNWSRRNCQHLHPR